MDWERPKFQIPTISPEAENPNYEKVRIPSAAAKYVAELQNTSETAKIDTACSWSVTNAIVILANAVLLISGIAIFILTSTSCDKNNPEQVTPFSIPDNQGSPQQSVPSSPSEDQENAEQDDTSPPPENWDASLTAYDKISNPNHPCGLPEVTPDLQKGRIVGGAEAVPNSWPYTVGLGILKIVNESRISLWQSCGATLISSRNALTAAHCFVADPELKNFYSVFASFHSTETYEGLKAMRVAVIRFHPKTNVFMNTTILVYDFALLTLMEEFTPTRTIQIACLPAIRKELPKGTLCWATGWGLTNGTGADKLLKQVVLDIVSEERCQREFYYSIETKSTICAGTTPGQDTCQGDSGGPLYHQEDGRWVVYGVTSYGFECGKGPMAAYGTVSYQMEWLCCFMSNLPACKDIRCVPSGEN